MEHLHGNNGEDELSCPACTGLHEPFEHPQPIAQSKIDELHSNIALVDSMLAEMKAEHAETCNGFFELQPRFDGDPNEGKKIPCAICFPDDYEASFETQSLNIGGEGK